MANAAIKTALQDEIRFDGDLAAPDPLPEASIDAALALMRDGRLFRYGEAGAGVPEAALLEQEFASQIGRKYCVGVNSGGSAMFIALKAAGVEAGDRVLVNAFTLAPVPGAIAHAGAEAVLVDIDDRLTIDIDDLAAKAEASGARALMLSHMRGHIADMTAVTAACERLGLTLIEDCAHTTGARWDGRLTGTFGLAGCFSAQSFKHVNAGEGGLIVTDDDDLAARAILLSGSYMLYEQHRARPPMEVFERWKYTTPNCSMRMSGLVAAILRPQFRDLDARVTRWREIYAALADGLAGHQNIRLPHRPAEEDHAPTSLQFFAEGMSSDEIQRFLAVAERRGVLIKWFGAAAPAGFTSRGEHWRYLVEASATPNADRLLARLCDIRLPIWLGDDDCAVLATIIRASVEEALISR